ncbi:MAG: alpha/beta hydrolase [Dactylosporangium sp.]|jgi:hypothetical protein|nr:alpha/beta hydrolase [Dactylosporangium sp.]
MFDSSTHLAVRVNVEEYLGRVTYVLIPGAGGDAWYWHVVERELGQRGHDVISVELPSDDYSAGLVRQTHFVTLADPGLREDGHRVIISDLWRQLKIVRWPRATA